MLHLLFLHSTNRKEVYFDNRMREEYMTDVILYIYLNYVKTFSYKNYTCMKIMKLK